MNQRNKGKSLLELPAEYTVIDLETTGFSSQYDNIIEIGCIKYRNGAEVGRYEKLVKPPRKIPYVVECITGITNEMVAESPTFEEIAQEIWEYLKGEKIIGHNVNFDINFLYDSFQRSLVLEFKNDFVDTMRIAKKLLPELKEKGYGLDNLCGYFNVAMIDRHRVISDCLLTNELLICLKKFVAEKNINLEDKGQYINFSEKLKNLKAKSATDNSHIFFGKCCVFTGKLEEFSRIEAAQIVTNIGGYCEDRITKKTNFLIVGDMDYRQGLNGYETSKLRKAKQLIEQKQDLQIIPESAFYDLVADYLSGE